MSQPRVQEHNRVPLAVWPAPQHSEVNEQRAGARPDSRSERSTAHLQALAVRIIDEYSSPGDVVLTLGAAAKPPITKQSNGDRRVIAIASENASDKSSPEGTVNLPSPNDIRVGDARQLREHLGDLCGSFDLVITSSLAQCDDVCECPYCEAQSHVAYEECFGALRPGGHLVTVTQNKRLGKRFVDVAAGTVQGATSAGFEYLQHNIALLCSVTGSGVATRLSFWENRATPHDRSDGVPQSRVVHGDVNVFVKPGAASV